MSGSWWSSPWALGGIVAAAGAGIGAVAGVLSGRKKFNSEDFGGFDDREDGDADLDPSIKRGRELIPGLIAQAGLPEDVGTFLNFVARGESGWVPTVGRGDPSLAPEGVKINLDMSESRAAATAYRRRADIFEACPHPPEDYQFGSGGLFAALPTYWLYHVRNTPLRCASPFEVFDPAFAIAGAYSFARGVSQHPAFEGNVRSLRAGWGSLNRMVKRSYDQKLPKWRKHANDLGLPASYIDGPAPQFPKLDLLELYHSMGGELALPGSAAVA
ncbi:MAG: hypothetical protein ACRBN8_19715 [Nannocystales bacterium]